MSDIATNINQLKKNLLQPVKLVAVSKTRPVSDILIAYENGQRLFGENRVQELLSKKDLVPEDVEWHLIGHLQKNKVKHILPYVSMIQSVDSCKLLRLINSEASKISKVIDCLLQLHIATEDTKFGFNMIELEDMLKSRAFGELKNIRICGVMGMSTYTSDKEQVRSEFRTLANNYMALKNRYFVSVDYFKEISMGMSGDYKIAIEEGSTIIRIGSLIFGERK